jgi:hypothetical protein
MMLRGERKIQQNCWPPESLANVRRFHHFTGWRAAFRPLQRTKFARLSNKVGRFDLADDEAA